MKKSSLILLLLALGMVTTHRAWGQGLFDADTTDNHRVIVGVRPLSLFVSGIEPTLEFKISRATSINLSAGYFIRGGNPVIVDGPYSGYRAEAQFRYYLLTGNHPTSMSGYYVAPYVQLKSMTILTDQWNDQGQFWEMVEETAGVYSFGGNVGYQYISATRFTMDMFLGGGLYVPTPGSVTENIHIPFVNNYELGITIRGGFSLGLVF